MTETPNDILDVAIVGGGISGLYAGWRLLTGRREDGGDRPRKVTLFESSGRTGGRLLTWGPLPGANPPLHAELGGMRFFPQQQLVWRLVDHFVREKKLEKPIRFYVGDPNGNNLWYLRETILKAADLSNPDRVPFRLDARGRYADPESILNAVIVWLLTANHAAVAPLLGGRLVPANWQEWDEVKPHLVYRNRPLWDIGFWNLLWDQLSPETYEFVTGAFGYYSLTNNWNAAEAMQVVSSDFTQNPEYHTLQEGYEALPQTVREEFEEAGGTVLLKHPVVSISGGGEKHKPYQLRIDGVKEPVLAHHVILAMPRRSLELLKETPLWRPDRVIRRGTRGPKTLREHITSVIPYPAFKLFLAYDTPWWRQPPVSIAAGRSVCDLPIRQTYYFPPVEKFKPDKPPMTGPGLVMASYDDLNAVPFWKALEPTEEWKRMSDDLMSRTVDQSKKAATAGMSKRRQKYHAQTQQAMIEDPGFYYAPPEMVRCAQEQLSMLHFNRPLPAPRSHPCDPRVFLAAYRDWGIDPFGGGWNFWAPVVDVQAAMERARRPFADEAIYIVGDAYSGSQGWVEGALTTAEKMLRESFGLAPAAWQPRDYYMGY